ncbi:mRNA-decapping enzyme 1A isoform X2 [Electrophorus electricus]|uniref:mRNA-decapping enzyme 1A isoform X2 n=1 Tax=Electrophorus electricus TaxID=8005 RepID=UPI0015D041BF|nr:mRNA-decapping enzyme 1A isoform X2 [Electrophorus electricus]
MLVFKMESVNKAGHLMSLAALQQYDPYINRLLDVTGQVALYKFNSKANEWEKTDIEGTLFVYARSASPHHGFTIMNRLSTENLVEPINKDLEFQLQDPFLLYRNASLGIYSIWFYDKADCQRIAQLMVQIVKQEALRAEHASPNRGRANGCIETRPMDILELLSKAKEEYHRSQSTDTDLQVNSDVAYTPEPVKTESSKPTVITSQHEKAAHGVIKQITVEELFGSSLPKDPAPLASGHNPSDPAPADSFLRGLTYAPPPLPLEPLLTPRLTADPGGPGLVPLLKAGGPRDPLHSVPPRLMAPSGAEGVPTLVCPQGAPAPQAAPRYVNPLKGDGHGMAKPAAVPGFIPTTLVTPQSFREPSPKAPAVFTSKTSPCGQNMDADTFAQAQPLVKTIPYAASLLSEFVMEAEGSHPIRDSNPGTKRR